MSNYEGMNGNGIVMKKDLNNLKKQLIIAHNRQIEGIKPKVLKTFDMKKASTRTTSFPIFECYTDDEEGVSIYEIGSISLTSATGEFRFSIGENNHAVDDAYEHSKVFQVLMNFIKKLPEKGEKYGAETYYYSEYDEDEFGHRTAGSTQLYGGWAKNNKKFA